MNTYNKFLMIFIIAIASALPIIASNFDIVTWEVTWNFYLIETMCIAAIALVFYTKHTIIFFCILSICLLFLNVREAGIVQNLRLSISFWVVYSACWLIYFEVCKTQFYEWIKMLPAVQHFLYYFTYFIISYVFSFIATATIFDYWEYASKVTMKTHLILIIIAFVVPTLTITAVKIIDMIGINHIFYFLTGTYKRPLNQKRVVLFLDMEASSSIAEKMAPDKAMGFISQFIYDASYSFRKFDGDIISYTGDGLVVLWRIDKVDKLVESIETLESRLNMNMSLYKHNFGMFPKFRIGVHSGQITLSQIGEEKLFLGLYGDVVNTAARLEQLNKSLETRILISENVFNILSENNKSLFESKGKQEIRGKEEQLEVFHFV